MSNKFPSLEAILKACENSEKKVTYFVPAPWTLDPMKGTEQLARNVNSEMSYSRISRISL
jgi:hypothetical protein